MVQKNSEIIYRARRVGNDFWCLLSLLPYVPILFTEACALDFSLSLSFDHVTNCGVIVVVYSGASIVNFYSKLCLQHERVKWPYAETQRYAKLHASTCSTRNALAGSTV